MPSRVQRIVSLERRAEQAEAQSVGLAERADAWRWEEARLVSDELRETGKTQSALGLEIGMATTRVSEFKRAWERWGSTPAGVRPRFWAAREMGPNDDLEDRQATRSAAVLRSQTRRLIREGGLVAAANTPALREAVIAAGDQLLGEQAEVVTPIAGSDGLGTRRDGAVVVSGGRIQRELADARNRPALRLGRIVTSVAALVADHGLNADLRRAASQDDMALGAEQLASWAESLHSLAARIEAAIVASMEPSGRSRR